MILFLIFLVKSQPKCIYLNNITRAQPETYVFKKRNKIKIVPQLKIQNPIQKLKKRQTEGKMKRQHSTHQGRGMFT